jgi:transcriptional regulator with XRE-family HTH domain
MAAPAFSYPRLRAIRAVAGKSRRELAEHARVSVSTIISYEHGYSVPSAAALGRLAAALGCSVADLYADPDEDDDPAAQYWSAAVAALPPLTPEAAESVGRILRRIGEPETAPRQVPA